MVVINVQFHHSHKKRIVWKHGPNWPFYATFYVENQAILEPIRLYRGSKRKQTKEQGSETVYQPIFLPFYKIIVRFCEDANKARSNCDIIGCNLSKKHKLTLYKTLNREQLRIINFSLIFARSYLYKNLGTDIQIL